MLDLCIQHNVTNKNELVDLMATSEMDDRLKISGQSILLNSAKVLSGILPACRHLKSESKVCCGMKLQRFNHQVFIN